MSDLKLFRIAEGSAIELDGRAAALERSLGAEEPPLANEICSVVGKGDRS